MARLDRYRIGIPRQLSEIRTQPWPSEGSLTCEAAIHITTGDPSFTKSLCVGVARYRTQFHH